MYPESILPLKNVLTFLENDLLIIGLMEEEFPVPTQVYGNWGKESLSFPAPLEKEPWIVMHRGIERQAWVLSSANNKFLFPSI